MKNDHVAVVAAFRGSVAFEDDNAFLLGQTVGVDAAAGITPMILGGYFQR